jgi:HEAT repeats
MGIFQGRLPLLASGAAVGLLAAILIYQQLSSVDQSEIDAEKSPTEISLPRSLKPIKERPEIPAPSALPNPLGSPDNQDWIEKRITALDQLAWRDDPESLGKILAELRNSVPEIRAAALAATRAFDSRDAIPYLDELSRDSKDPLEQKALTDLIEHLKLPTLLEQGEAIKPE